MHPKMASRSNILVVFLLLIYSFSVLCAPTVAEVAIQPIQPKEKDTQSEPKLTTKSAISPQSSESKGFDNQYQENKTDNKKSNIKKDGGTVNNGNGGQINSDESNTANGINNAKKGNPDDPTKTSGTGQGSIVIGGQNQSNMVSEGNNAGSRNLNKDTVKISGTGPANIGGQRDFHTANGGNNTGTEKNSGRKKESSTADRGNNDSTKTSGILGNDPRKNSFTGQTNTENGGQKHPDMINEGKNAGNKNKENDQAKNSGTGVKNPDVRGENQPNGGNRNVNNDSTKNSGTGFGNTIVSGQKQLNGGNGNLINDSTKNTGTGFKNTIVSGQNQPNGGNRNVNNDATRKAGTGFENTDVSGQNQPNGGNRNVNNDATRKAGTGFENTDVSGQKKVEGGNNAGNRNQESGSKKKSGTVQTNTDNIGSNLNQDYVSEESSSSGHFMGYFLTVIVLCVAGYVMFHNKQKIIAFIVEGRSGKQRRRAGGNGGDYKRLQSNVEEVI